MLKFIRLGTLAILLLAIISPGCKKDKNSTPQSSQEQQSVQSDSSGVKVFYLIPSPDDIFGFADAPGLYFKQDLLNPPENLDKYNDTKTQETNFGVYSADLAYCAAFGKKELTKQYLNVVKSLSEKIGLSSVFTDSLLQKIDNLGTDKQELISLSNDVYFDIIKLLEKTDRSTTLALMAAGGWLETIYLVINLVDYDQNKVVVQQIANQKVIFDNLYKFLEQNDDDPNVNAVKESFVDLKNIFDNLKIVEVQNTDKQTADTNEIIVGGNYKIVMTKEQFMDLKTVINKVRNNLTLNNIQ